MSDTGDGYLRSSTLKTLIGTMLDSNSWPSFPEVGHEVGVDGQLQKQGCR